ncbi:MAG: SAM-dependent methyltransferase [Bacteroidales bacterium]|nr:SAM-dependent methyltransferase [Bacteroidales bacterium]
MQELQITVIGHVRNEWKKAKPFEADAVKNSISTIVVKKEYADGLYKIENFRELNVLFYFDRSLGYELRTTTRSGDYRGVFACCSPRRPSLIGLTTVELLKVEENILTVTGLDAINNTPVLDIKRVIHR